MAITLTRDLQSVQVFEAVREVHVSYRDTFDDPDSSMAPVMTTTRLIFVEGDDVSNEHQLVQDIAAVVWA